MQVAIALTCLMLVFLLPETVSKLLVQFLGFLKAKHINVYAVIEKQIS